MTRDAEVFGEDKWVHCAQHGYPHLTGWCTVSTREKVVLNASNREEAYAQCRELGLWLFFDEETDT